MHVSPVRGILIVLLCSYLSIDVRPVAASSDANAVIAWSEFARALHEQAPSPLFEAHTSAIQHAAIHDALNTIDPRYERYSDCHGLTTLPDASVEAAIAQASRDTLAALWAHNPLANPAIILAIQNLIAARYTAVMAIIPDGPAKISGQLVGAQCAAAMLEKRATDGFDDAGPPFSATPIYVPGSEPGDYQFTPPNDNPGFAFAPGWGNVTPFAIELERHRVRGPDALRSFAYALDFNYLKAIGRADSSVRTAEQTEIAQFWYELAPIGWNRIAAIALRQRHVGLWKSARILALLNFGLADGYTASFAAKYHFAFWRPITAIRAADADGNPFTHQDESWTPLCETPPIPEYPSTHTVLGAVAATVLTDHLGHLSFTTTSTSLQGVTRRFHSFVDGAVENGLSRAYCGIHFVHAIVDGYHQGQRIGSVAARQLPPVQ